MATVVIDTQAIEKRNKRTREHRFFWAMSLVLAFVVLVGFAKTYFLAPYFQAKPLAAPIVHVHAALFTAWIVLLVAQTSLASSGYVRIHRRLGLVALALAPTVFILGVLVAIEMLNRLYGTPHFDADRIYAVALSEIIGFAAPTFLALRLRRRPDVHKRLILIGTTSMMTAGFGRWPIKFLLHQPIPAMSCTFGLLAMVIAYDWKSSSRIHPATALGVAWVVLLQAASVPFSHTFAWHAFALWSRSLSL